MRKKAYRTLKQQKKRASTHHVGKRYVRSNIKPTTEKLDEDDEEYAKKEMFSVKRKQGKQMKTIDYIRVRKNMYVKRMLFFAVLAGLFFVGDGFWKRVTTPLVFSGIGIFILCGLVLNFLVYVSLIHFEIPFSSKVNNQIKSELEEELTDETKQEIDKFGYMTVLCLLIRRR